MTSLTVNLTQLKTVYGYGEKLYEIRREIPVQYFYRKDGTIVAEAFNAWKEHLDADHVLKTPTHFVFCRTVEDAEIAE